MTLLWFLVNPPCQLFMPVVVPACKPEERGGGGGGEGMHCLFVGGVLSCLPNQWRVVKRWGLPATTFSFMKWEVGDSSCHVPGTY